MKKHLILLPHRLAGVIFITFLLLTLFTCKVDDDTVLLDADKLPGLEYLGRGYDFFGEYADVSAVKSPLIDLESFTKEVNAYGVTYAIPDAVDFILYNKNEISSIYGQDIQEYQKSLSIAAGAKVKCWGFKASVKTNFSEQYYSRSDFQFITVKNLLSRWRLTLPLDIPTLQGMLTQSAASDLEFMDPGLLFSKYGQFMLAEAIIGARADYSASALRTQEFSSTEFQLSARMSYSWLVGSASANISVEDEEKINNFRSQSVVNVVTKGGASQYGQSILEGNYGPWIESVENNPVLCDFTQRSLIPIWELCKDPVRKAELEQYFEQLGEAEKLPDPTQGSLAITDIEIVKVIRPDNIAWDNPYLAQIASRQKPGWRVLPQNMNNGSCDKALFLAFKEVSPWTGDGGYSDLFIDYLNSPKDSSISVPPGYGRLYCRYLPVPDSLHYPNITGMLLGCYCNLNTCSYTFPFFTGSGILLYYLNCMDGEPIRDLKIVVTDEENPDPPEGYVWVLSNTIEPANLDWGLGNPKKFLAYRKNLVPHGGIWEPNTDTQ